MKWDAKKHRSLTDRRTEVHAELIDARTGVTEARETYATARQQRDAATDPKERTRLQGEVEDAAFDLDDKKSIVRELRAEADEITDQIRKLEKVRPSTPRAIKRENDLLSEICLAKGFEGYKDASVHEALGYRDVKAGPDESNLTNDLDGFKLARFLREEGLASRAADYGITAVGTTAGDNEDATPFTVGNVIYEFEDFGGMIPLVNVIRTENAREIRPLVTSDNQSAGWISELEAVTEKAVANPVPVKIGGKILTAGYHDVSTQALRDPAYSVAQNVLNTFQERIAIKANQTILTGVGSQAAKDFKGIIPSVSAVAARILKSGNAATLGDAPLDLLASLSDLVEERYLGRTVETGPWRGMMNMMPPAGYGGTPGATGFAMNRGTWLVMRISKGEDQYFLGNPGNDALFDANNIGTVFGRRMRLVQDMPSIAADAYVVLFGNFGYVVFRLIQGMRIRMVDGLAVGNWDGTRCFGFQEADGAVLTTKALAALRVKA